MNSSETKHAVQKIAYVTEAKTIASVQHTIGDGCSTLAIHQSKDLLRWENNRKYFRKLMMFSHCNSTYYYGYH